MWGFMAINSVAVVSDRPAPFEAPPPIARVSARVYPLAKRRLNTLFVTSELSDFVQVGGLGAVSASLPRALGATCDVRILMPGFRQVLAKAPSSEVIAKLPGAGAIPPCSIAVAKLADGLTVYIVLCEELYEREGSPYTNGAGVEHQDNDVRFARLGLAAAELAERGGAGWRPDLLHLNDWPTALAAGYLHWRRVDTPCLLTIHNLAHQGQFDGSRASALAIPPAAFNIHGVEFFGRISFLKAGLSYAAHVNTVSNAYAEEITRPEFGCGLDGMLRERAAEGRLTGIVNGIDKSWDPRADKRCPYLFDPQRWKGRYADFIRGAFRLSLARAPLFAFVSRLVHQKGVDLVLQASEFIAERGGQMVVIGHGEPDAEHAFRALARRHPDAVGVRIGFDPEEARALFAGGDFLLMPSRYEPCGLSQMYAQRLGAIPIAHRTGGLGETIHHGKTGLLFDRADAGSLNAAIAKAFDLYQAPKDFQQMRRAAMALNFDWRGSAERYDALYREIDARRRSVAAAS
jgi:starch synthase